MPDNARGIPSWLSCGLAFVGGYGDAAGYLVAKTFTGHLTGNLVLMAIGVAGGDWRATLRNLLAIVTFLTGVFLSALLSRVSSLRSLRQVLLTEIILIGAAALAAARGAPAAASLLVICLALALGLQNGAVRRSGGISVHTSFVTGMLMSLITAETDRHFPQRAKTETQTAPGIKLLLGIWISFVLGAGVGAAAILHFRAPAVAGAALFLAALLLTGGVISGPTAPLTRAGRIPNDAENMV